VFRGVVNAGREPIAPLHARRPRGTELDVDAVVDPGFTASLTLPATDVAALGLEWQSGGGAILADGEMRQYDFYAAEVAWGGGWRPALGDEVLLGMRLLAGHELRIAVVAGGVVEITPLP
jgi:predicted aspartyl protease